MSIQTTAHEPIGETPEQVKARRNAEYMAKLDKSFREMEEGKVFVTTIEALEA